MSNISETPQNFTSGDIAALRSAIASGATSVQYQDRRVQYRSLEEMLQILRWLEGNGVTGGNFGRSYRKYYSLPSDLDGKQVRPGRIEGS